MCASRSLISCHKHHFATPPKLDVPLDMMADLHNPSTGKLRKEDCKTETSVGTQLVIKILSAVVLGFLLL